MVDEKPEEPEELVLLLAMMDAGHPAFGLSGRVADAWAMFEFHIDRTIWKLAVASDGAGACKYRRDRTAQSPAATNILYVCFLLRPTLTCRAPGAPISRMADAGRASGLPS
jgi:hypothetical protein